VANNCFLQEFSDNLCRAPPGHLELKLDPRLEPKLERILEPILEPKLEPRLELRLEPKFELILETSLLILPLGVFFIYVALSGPVFYLYCLLGKHNPQ
jgi:hypothetical protein